MEFLNHRYFVTRVAVCISLAVLNLISFPTLKAQETVNRNIWKSLFNGKDLSGWGTYLIPSTAAENKETIGLNKDPHGTFAVVNGEIRVSGQDWGGFFSNESFSNYHLKYKVKFGEKKWAPRENALMDGGLLFHCSLPFDYGSKCWMRSIEMQIQETEIGDYHNVGAGIPEMQLTKSVTAGGEAVDQYDPFSPFKRTNTRVYRSGNFESKHGEWTDCELIARNADAVFIVNGFVVNRLYNLFQSDMNEQTTSGQLQFQSEGAEHFLKDIKIRSLKFFDKQVHKLIASKSDVLLNKTNIEKIEINNAGETVEIIAAELLGKNLEDFDIKLPHFPLLVKKGEKFTIEVSRKAGRPEANKVILKLETEMGPVNNFAVVIH